jgi:hypothetical protein
LNLRSDSEAIVILKLLSQDAISKTTSSVVGSDTAFLISEAKAVGEVSFDQQ